MDGVGILEDEVRELIRRRGIDPVRDRPGVTALVDEVIADYDARSVLGAVPPLVEPGAAHKAVLDAVAGFGPLQVYLDEPDVEVDLDQNPAFGSVDVAYASRGRQRWFPSPSRRFPP